LLIVVLHASMWNGWDGMDVADQTNQPTLNGGAVEEGCSGQDVTKARDLNLLAGLSGKANLSVLAPAVEMRCLLIKSSFPHVLKTPLYSTTTGPAATASCNFSQFLFSTRSEAGSNFPGDLIRVDTSTY